MHGNRTRATIPPYVTGSLRCTMLLCCCGFSEVATLLRSGSLLCCVRLPPGITAAEMPLLSFFRPSVFDITIVLPWSYFGSLVPICWGSCSVPLVLTCVCVSCVLCCLCCPLCVCWYRVYASRVLCGGSRSVFGAHVDAAVLQPDVLYVGRKKSGPIAYRATSGRLA